jgi:hypothetical protein
MPFGNNEPQLQIKENRDLFASNSNAKFSFRCRVCFIYVMYRRSQDKTEEKSCFDYFHLDY